MPSTLGILALALLAANSVPAAPEASPFDLAAWKAGPGAHKNLKAWSKENPGPWRSYFKADSADCARKWYVNLGPLGLRTLMHDRSWGVFPGCREVFPKALTDEHGLVWNAFEVLGVKSGSPAEGKLQPGDLILGMNDAALMSSQHVLVGRKIDNRMVRGLEMHAGLLIDRAEGVGEISLQVLRLPDGMKDTPLAGLRAWKTVGELALESGKDAALSVPLGKTSLCRVRKEPTRGKIQTDGLFLRSSDGTRIPVEMPAKRGAGTLFGDPLEIPAGAWTLEGKLTANRACRLTVETMPVPPLPEALKKHLKTITLKLDRIGSFGGRFDPEGEKARNYAAMLAHRLTVQQDADGSWKVGGYASRAFPTSMCGLALLSTGDPACDEAVRRAAYYVANHGEHDKWSYSNGMWLMFLGEYYLRTRDEGILPALRMKVRTMRRFVLSDYTAGHSFAKPGYGGGGWIGGGGAIACGLAIASHTPAMEEDDLAFLDRMLGRAQELGPNGRIPYGRGSSRDKARKPVASQESSCASGPYLFASLIRGGGGDFARNALKRYATPPFGSAENGHATQTLHFVWGCLAIANASPDAHRANMEAYLWKFATLREFDGFINKNNYRTEYHNGDGVIGEPYWRTAGYLLVLNAHKRNLAITGNPEYRREIRGTPLVYHTDRALWNAALRNWALVEATLGQQAPESFAAAVKSLRALAPGPDLGERLLAALKSTAPQAAVAILALPKDPPDVTRAQLAQLVLGHGFQASFVPAPGLQAAGEGGNHLTKNERKLAAMAFARKIERGEISSCPHRLSIRPAAMIRTDLDGKSSVTDMAAALFPMEKLHIEVADPAKRIFHKAVATESMNAPDELTAVCPDFKVGGAGRLMVRVSYRSAGVEISYTTPMDLPATESRGYVPFLTRVPVDGSVLDDYSRSYSMRILLDTGAVLGCEQHGDPIDFLLEGGRYRFLISPNSGAWGHDLRAARALSPDYRVAPVRRVSSGPVTPLADANRETGLTVSAGSELVFELAGPATISSVFMSFGPEERRLPHRLDAMVDGEWVLMRRGAAEGLMPVIPATTSRIRLSVPAGSKGRLSELRFITPAPARSPAPRFSW